MDKTSVLTLLPSTISERESFIVGIESEILEGNRNPLEIEIQLKNLEDLISEIRKRPNIKNAVSKEADKYPDKVFDFKGCKITKVSRGTYDFSNCGHSGYLALQRTKKHIDEEVKAIESVLKQADKVQVVDEETGQICNSPFVKYTDYLKIEIAK